MPRNITIGPATIDDSEIIAEWFDAAAPNARTLREKVSRRIKEAFINQHRAMFGEEPEGSYTGLVHRSFLSTYWSQSSIEMGEGDGLRWWVLRINACTDDKLPHGAMEVWRTGNTEDRVMHIIHTPRAKHDPSTHVPVYLYEAMMRQTQTPFVQWLAQDVPVTLGRIYDGTGGRRVFPRVNTEETQD